MSKAFDDAIRRITLWCGREGPGLGRVTCPDTRGQERAIAEVTARIGRPTARVDLPLQPTARATAEALEEALQRAAAEIVFVTGWEGLGVLPPAETLDALGALILRRERLAALPCRQVWWLPPQVARAFATRAVDLEDWFTMRVELPATAAAQGAPWTPERGNLSVAAARGAASDLARRFERALERGEPAEEAWRELGAPAGEALRQAGLMVEAGALEAQLEALLVRLRSADAPRRARPAAPPPMVWNIPPPPAGFVGREAELAWLDQASESPVAMVGLGGVGKSSLARAWAWQQRGRVSLGWWLRAEHREIYEEDLLELGRALGLLDPTRPIEDRPRALEGVYSWLATPPEGRWLLIADNAGDPAALRLPTGPGVVLVTSRDRRWERAARGLPMSMLPPKQSRALLLAGTEDRAADADAVAAHLGHLPLALAQARAWCQEHNQTLAACLRRLEKPGSGVLRYPVGTGEATVAQTWSLAVEDLSAEARAILEQLAFLAPEDIPVEAIFGDVEALDVSLEALHRASLVDRKGDRLDVHRLVQLVTREGLSAERAAQRLEEVQRRVGRAMPDPEDPAGWPLWRRLGAHVEVVAVGDRKEVADLLGEYAFFLGTQAQHAEARRLEERALDITERALGPDHPETAIRLNNLASTLSALGEHARARPLHERALDITELALGPDHPDTAIRLGNLASTLSALGENARARLLQERALDITERALGPDHPSTAIRLNNLASTLSALGEHARARPLHERALDITELALGPDHPDTAIRLGNLASTLSALGEHARARLLQERALDITERALGPDHPSTAIRLNNLAATLSDLGEYARARPLHERALDITERALGPDHPTTALRLGNLAVTHWDLGEPDRAEQGMTRAVQILERRLGPNHPTTVHFARELAFYSAQRKE